MVYVLAVLLGVIVLLAFLLGEKGRRLKLEEQALRSAERMMNEYAGQALNLRKTIEGVARNREEADEEIEELHSGDACGNAIERLRERKG